MNLLNKLTLKSLKLNKKRTIVTIIGIILSVALMTAVSTMYMSAIKSFINYQINLDGNFHVEYMDVAKNELDTFLNNRKIENTIITENLGYAKLDGDLTPKNEYKPYIFVSAFTKDAFKNLSIKLVDGRFPENENEIVIPSHLRENGKVDLKVGEEITLEVGKRVSKDGYEFNQDNPFIIEYPQKNDDGTFTEPTLSEEQIVDATKITYKIVGEIQRPNSYVEPYEAPGYTVITYKDIKDITNKSNIFTRYTQKGLKEYYKTTANILEVDEKLYEKAFQALYDNDTDAYNQIIKKTKYKIKENSYLVMLEKNPFKSSRTGASQLGTVAGIIILIIIFTSVYCIKNSFDISITEKTKQYGMLRSIGATKKQVRKNVFFEASVLGAIGIPLGLLLGIVASYILVIVCNYFLKDASQDFQIVFAVHILALIVSVVLGIITIYLSALKSAVRASKITPIEAIRNSINIKINAKKLKSPKIIKKIFGVGGEISYKNLKRNKKKYRTTVISIFTSVVVFISLASFMDIAFTSTKLELKYKETNLSVSVNDYEEKDTQNILQITKFDNIEDYTVNRNKFIKAKGNLYSDEYFKIYKMQEGVDDGITDTSITLVSIGKEQYDKYIKKLGLKYDDVKDKGILVNQIKVPVKEEKKNKIIEKYYKPFSIKKGDKINCTIEDKDIVNFDLEIMTVTDKEPFGMINQGVIIISDEYMNTLNPGNYVNIQFKSTDPYKLQDDIEKYLGTSYAYNIDNTAERVRIMTNLFTLVGIFLYGFITVISLIGITNIFNTITTNVQLRKREFAMLKSVGMTNKEFNRMIRLESIFMGVKSLIFGIPIAIIISKLLHHYTLSNTNLPYKIPIIPILISIIVVFLLIFILMKYSVNKVNKQNIIETIRNENI